MNAKFFLALLGGAVALSLTSAAQEAKEADDEPLRCLSMSSIRSTKVIDDSTVLFYQGRRVFVNRLDRECLGLARSGTFTYQVQSGARYVRLCDSDSITVLETGGRGFNCGLGHVRADLCGRRLESLLSGPNTAIVTTPVELPKDDEPAAPAAEPAPPAAEPAPQ